MDKDQELLGEGFADALEEIKKVRINRREQYGDTYSEDSSAFLYFQIENKLKRLKLQFKDFELKREDKMLSVAKDSLIDLCCYSMFLIEKIKKIQDEIK